MYMAFAEPYTFTDLKQYLNYIESSYFTKEVLCYTIIGNPCYVLTITSKGKKSCKQGVVLTARAHPGETVASWMIQGAINFLLSEAKEAKRLREKFVFKIVPMLNPDGVINGNYRCSLAGCDLNRKYSCPSKTLHPTIYYLKRMVKEFNKVNPVVFYCDFHGHSKSKDVFMYGNTDEQNPEYYRIFPFIMSKLNDSFSFTSSKFVVQKAKSSTARVVMWKELNIPSVYTIEASFYGATNGIEQFTVNDYMVIGASLCKALNLYEKVFDEVHNDHKKNYKTIAKCNETLDLLYNKETNKEDAVWIAKEFKEHVNEFSESCSDEGSDSNPSEDNLNEREVQKNEVKFEERVQGLVKSSGCINSRRLMPNKVVAQYNRSKIELGFIRNRLITKNNAYFLISYYVVTITLLKIEICQV